MENYKKKGWLEKQIEKNMKNMSYEDAVDKANKSARLLEINEYNKDIFDESVEIITNTIKYIKSSQYNPNEWVEIALYKSNDSELYNESDLFIEIVEIATTLVKEHYREGDLEGRQAKVFAFSIKSPQ